MKRPKITIERDEETGVFIASWDDPRGGGITTQAESLEDLITALEEAVQCHFEECQTPYPREVSLHFETDPVLQFA